MDKFKKYGKCLQCKRALTKDEYGLSIKMLGEQGSKVCIKCLAEEFLITEDELLDKIEDYKLEGCKLFQ